MDFPITDLKEVGLGTGMLFIAVMVIRSCGKFFASALYRAGDFIGPIIVKMSDAHCDTMNTVKEESKRQSTAIIGLATSLEFLVGKSQENTEILQKIHEHQRSEKSCSASSN
jgi:hypothetical protein